MIHLQVPGRCTPLLPFLIGWRFSWFLILMQSTFSINSQPGYFIVRQINSTKLTIIRENRHPETFRICWLLFLWTSGCVQINHCLPGYVVGNDLANLDASIWRNSNLAWSSLWPWHSRKWRPWANRLVLGRSVLLLVEIHRISSVSKLGGQADHFCFWHGS